MRALPGDQSGLLIPSDSDVPVISNHQSPFEVSSDFELCACGALRCDYGLLIA